MNINLNIPAIEKLLDYAASGIVSIAGPYLAPWKARQEAKLRIPVKMNTDSGGM